MTSPSAQVNSNIITPNNHASIIIQGNDEVVRLLKINKRFIIAGRPFKLLAFQNALFDDISTPLPTLMYLDLYLDEIHANDNLTTQVADNGAYDYAITINAQDLNVTEGATGTLTATTTFNGQQVTRQVDWVSSDTSVVTIDNTGAYTVVGAVGTTATITANVDGNVAVTDSIIITVANATTSTPIVILSPTFTKIRQYESISFVVEANYGGQAVTLSASSVSLSQSNIVLSNSYLTIVQNGNNYTITANKIASAPQTLYIQAESINPAFSANTTVALTITSMMG